ncbi:MAG: hypothetical protein PHE84_07775 [bacterium]|nr:hypothetical protein [bacterium]
MSNTLITAAILCGLVGLICLGGAVWTLSKRKLIGTVFFVLLAIIAFLKAALFVVIIVSIQGYHTLIKEELAATVKIEPEGPQRFTARFVLPDGREEVFSLAGDQFYVDAHILKWKPIVNILGLHTVYELDRVSGRYINIDDERNKPRTVFELSRKKPLDLFDLRRRFAILSRLVDAEYGSASFVGSTQTEELRVLVSTTGLLIRRAGQENR